MHKKLQGQTVLSYITQLTTYIYCRSKRIWIGKMSENSNVYTEKKIENTIHHSFQIKKKKSIKKELQANKQNQNIRIILEFLCKRIQQEKPLFATISE